MIPIIGIILFFLGLCFISRYLYWDYKIKKEKSFLIIGLGILMFWAFGGIGLITIGILLILFWLLN